MRDNHTKLLAAAPCLLVVALLVAPSSSSTSSPSVSQDDGAAEVARTCPPEWMCDGEYFGADVVFVGRVTRIARRGRGKGRALIRFAVERGYRGLGAKDAEVEVASAEGVGAAGHGFRVGETYLVHADASYSMKRLDLSTLTVSAKTPARLAADAREEMACIEERKRLRPEAAGSHPFVLGGKAIARPKPAYPAEAKAARASGTVTVRLTVDESGRVTDAEVLCGHPLLTAAVREAALRARYSPTLMRGRPVKVQTAVAYTFSLD